MELYVILVLKHVHSKNKNDNDNLVWIARRNEMGAFHRSTQWVSFEILSFNFMIRYIDSMLFKPDYYS